MSTKYFNPHAKDHERAYQAWLVLIGLASNRQTTTYLELSKKMYDSAAQGTLGQILGHVSFYCAQNDLPPLNVLVVNDLTGKPGEGFPNPGDAPLGVLRERVFKYPWFKVWPPTPEQLEKAWERANRKVTVTLPS